MQTAFELGKIGPLLEIIHRLENEKGGQIKTIQDNLEKSTEEELDALQSFLKSAGFSKTKSTLYASSMLFVHAIRSVSQLQELSASNSLEPLLNLMLISEIDKEAIIKHLQKYTQ
jgi:virulence-associated protein VapD